MAAPSDRDAAVHSYDAAAASDMSGRRGRQGVPAEGAARSGGAEAKQGRARQGLGWLAILVAAWAIIAVRHRAAIFWPPYEDQAVGLWTEADFLVESRFDYYALRYDVPHFMSEEHGPRSYMISVLPTLVALLMELCPSIRAAIATAHLATFALSAATAVLLFVLVRPLAGGTTAALSAAALLTTPLFAAQTELVGMDVPLTPLMLLVIWLVAQRRYTWAAVASTGAFLVKATGSLATLATIGYLAVLLVGGRGRVSRGEQRLRAIGLAANVVALGFQSALVWWGDTSVALRAQIEWPEVVRLSSAVYWCPDLVVLLGVAVIAALIGWTELLRTGSLRTAPLGAGTTVGTGVVGAGMVGPGMVDHGGVSRSTVHDHPPTRADGDVRVDGGRGPIARATSAVERAWSAAPVVSLAWIVLALMLVANARYIFIPRYFTSAVPLVYIVLISAAFAIPTRKRVGQVLLAGVVLFNLANSHGRFFPDIAWVGAEEFERQPWLHARSCPFTERSLEYRDDLESNRRAIRLLAAEYGEHPLLIALPQLFYVSKPRLGYVEQPLDAHDVGTFATAVASLTETLLPAALDPARPRPICYFSGNARMTLPPRTLEDRIIYQDRLDPALELYILEPPADMPHEAVALDEWYLDRTWPGPWLVERAELRALYLARTNRLAQAIAETRQALAWLPDEPQLARLLEGALGAERALEQQGAQPGAVQGSFSSESNSGGAAGGAASLADDGTELGAVLVHQFPVLATADWQLAAGLARLQGRSASVPENRRLDASVHDAAEGAGESTGAGDQADHYRQALERLAEGRWREAREAFRCVANDVGRTGKAALAQYALGVMALEQGDLDEAATRLATAHAALAEMPEVPRALAELYLVRAEWIAAEGASRAAIDVAPQFAEAHHCLALALLGQGRTDEAHEALRQVLRCDEAHTLAQFHLRTLERRVERAESEPSRSDGRR